VNWKKWGRKLLCPVCRYCSRICFEGVRKRKKVRMEDLRFFQQHRRGVRFLRDATSCLWVSGFGCSEGSYCLHHQGQAAFFLYCWTFESEDIMSLRNFGDCSPSVKASHLWRPRGLVFSNVGSFAFVPRFELCIS